MIYMNFCKSREISSLRNVVVYMKTTWIYIFRPKICF